MKGWKIFHEILIKEVQIFWSVQDYKRYVMPICSINFHNRFIINFFLKKTNAYFKLGYFLQNISYTISDILKYIFLVLCSFRLRKLSSRNIVNLEQYSYQMFWTYDLLWYGRKKQRKNITRNSITVRQYAVWTPSFCDQSWFPILRTPLLPKPKCWCFTHGFHAFPLLFVTQSLSLVKFIQPNVIYYQHHCANNDLSLASSFSWLPSSLYL